MRENDTYQLESNNKLENIEWDDIWRQNAPDNEKPRVLLIGDSISRSYRGSLNEILSGEVYADQLSTSKSVADKGFIGMLDYMKAQNDRYEIIVFNNGLHGFYLNIKEYEENYRNIILYLKKIFPDSTFILALSTPVRSKDNLDEFDDINSVVVERNEAVKKIAEDNGIDYIDYYTLFDKNGDMYTGDGIHVIDRGQKLLAEKCAEMIKVILGDRNI
ncbi:MAG: SGNH/GDSL hydrolase family protein [Clostridia bacterium]|nr:SGNH/GDSL hydrolase family protein [Clostridia bacterium]